MVVYHHDTKNNPPIEWRIDVNATCPKCASVATFGSAESGAAIVKCAACGFSCQFPESFAAVARQVVRETFAPGHLAAESLPERTVAPVRHATGNVYA
jgi:Zn ribbon nucleic-acid-binding protein